jgi:hypothetical protein
VGLFSQVTPVFEDWRFDHVSFTYHEVIPVFMIGSALALEEGDS